MQGRLDHFRYIFLKIMTETILKKKRFRKQNPKTYHIFDNYYMRKLCT